MTDLTLTINGSDYSHIVTKAQYKTFRTPVISYSYVDLDKVTHQYIKRWKGGLEVEVNPIFEDMAADLYEDLIEQPCEVSYYSFQLGQVVTESMIVSESTMQDAKAFSDGHFIGNLTLRFEEL